MSEGNSKVGYVETVIEDDEIAVLREAQKAWADDKEAHLDWAENQFGWRRAERFSPDMWLVVNWQKMVDLGWLQCDNTRIDLYTSEAEFRITDDGAAVIKSIDANKTEREAYAKGRADAMEEARLLVLSTMMGAMSWREGRAESLEQLIREVRITLGNMDARRIQLESTLQNRDKVDEWAAHLLDWAADTHVANHGERRGHMTMVAAMLRFYVGSRNVQPVPPDPSGIPF